MKQTLAILTIPILLLLLSNCRSNNRVTVYGNAADGLDLKAVTDAALKSKSAADFEKKLNNPTNKINNLDLNEDKIIDYIKVTEINDSKSKGFSLTVEVDGKQEQEICTIQIEKESNSHSRIQTHGNSHIYGHNHYYHRSSPISNILFWHYITSSHQPYRSNYGYKNYPRGFSESKPVSKEQYSGFHNAQPYAKEVKKSSTSTTTQAFTSPNRNKIASNIKSKLRNPSTSQKSFQKADASKRSSNSSRYGSSSSSRSRSSFGGGK